MADPDDDDRKMPAVDKAASSMEQEESNDEQSDANKARDSQKSTVGSNKQQSGSSEEDGQDSSSDSDSTSSSDDDSRDEEDEDEEEPQKDKVVLGGDGHPLSAYEIQRLERIRRNKEYLASLGLEKNTLARAAKPAKKPKPARKKHPDLKRRSSISRASKEKAIRYSEHKDKEGNAASGDTKKEPWKRPKENRAARMERFIHDEFRRIGKEQRHHLKRAKKNVRAADVEYRIATQRAERYERKRRQQVETQQIIARMEEERRALGGQTAREMLQEFDMRSSEIYTALRLFDELFNHHEDMAEWAKQQEENQRKMEIIDAMDRFPRALKDAVRDLDMMLLERSPRDPAPPRRGTRKRKSVDTAEEEEPDAKMRTIESPDGSKARLAAGSTWGSLASAITAETLSSSAGAHLDKASPSAVVDEPDSKPAAKENSKKKRRDVIPKIVGGWVSPEFAKDIDRSWLEADSIPKKFDLSSYIPQVGDTILYYPAGHRQFLEANSDVLGKKTRNITRLTLWDRAKKEKAKLEKAAAEENPENKATKEKSSNALTWWNEEWLSLMKGDLERYPIICRVEKTHAEFPPDPNADKKTVIKDNENGSIQVTWAVKKGGKMKKQVNEPLRLAVMLRPLTPLLPPRQLEEDDAADEDLTLPPNFNVVTFPSKASPFLVPFSWAYRLSYSLSEGASIRLVSKPEWSGKVKSFKSLDGRESSRLDDKMDAIRRLCVALKSGPKPFAASLEEALVSNGRASIPITDACTVIERFETALKRSGNDTTSSSQPAKDKMTSLMELIRGTLPLWNEVIAGSGTGKKLEMSAWELSPVDSKSVTLAGPLDSVSADIDAETGLVYRIDEPLRAKIECTIEDFLRDTPDAAMFCPLVSDEDAPSYSCAVPRGMAFNKILRRLRPDNRVGGPRCYYRSIDSLLGDISFIADNCILYNSLDSYVVEKVLEIVPAVKRLIAQVASSHFKEKEAREKSVEERRQAIMLQFNAPVLLDDENEQSESKSRSRGSTKQQNLQPPYTEFLHRSWIQDAEPDKSWDISIHHTPNRPTDERTPTFEAVRSGWWVPQSGDTVFYSRSLHADFVKGHHPSLTTDQCELPRFSGDNDTTPQSESENAIASDNSLVDSLQKRWLVGKVVWVRAAFPRAPSKRDSDYENTFDVASPILDLGIRFNYSWALNRVYKVSWRPCSFQEEQPVDSKDTLSSNEQGKRRTTQDSNGRNLANAGDESKKPAARDRCGACHLYTDTSFVRPAWIPIGSEDSAEENSSPYLLPDGSIPADNLFSLPIGIPCELISSIDRCLNLLKRRCLDGVPADHIDPRLSIENVKKGIAPVAAKIGKSLPSFNRVLAKGNSGGAEAATRGIEKFDKSAVKLLADANYLPQWTLSLSEGTKKTNRDGIAQSLALHETLSPNPNFSLELIQTRLRNGYYRSVGSLAHDIEEAYISSVLLLLAKPASAKQGQAVSIRRIAKALSASKDTISFAKVGAKKNANKVVSGNEGFVPSNDVERHGPKKSGLSEKEQQWVEKLLQVRKLYSTALACAVQPDCMERVFGTGPKKKPKTAPKNKPSITDEREQTFRKARNTLGFIYHALSRDPCDNRPPEASWNPSIKLKIRFTGQEAPVKENSNDEGGVENESELDIDMTKPIVIEPADYEENDALVQFFFGRPGRMHTCARCNAYSRSMMMCRVRKKHSRPDFDWTSVFQGTGGIDGLLYTLRTGQQPSEVEASEHMPSLTSQLPVSLPSSQGTATASAATVENNTKQVDPASLLEKAVAAVSLANSVLEKAEKFSKDTVRLSEEFVGAYFPIDPADDHYNYCILCGLIGDVICCEGCPNVVHPHCVNLTEIPSEDWYCSKCVRNGKVPSVGTESQKPSAVAVASAGPDVLPASMAAPYGLDDEAERLEAMLGELKAARPIRPKKPKRATNEQKDGDSGGDDDDDGDDGDDDAEEEEDQPPSSPERRSRRSCAADPSSPGDEGGYQSKVNDELQRVARKDTGKESTKKRPLTADVENTDAKKPSQKRSRPRANKHLRDALHVLSTMALAFLESIDVTTADQFLSTRTSELAIDFMAWRKQEKMTTLKGSGHSATISGWKAAVRKAAESMGDDLAMTDHSSDDAEEEDQPPSSSSGDDACPDVRSQPKRIRVGTRVKKKFGNEYYLGTVLECPSSENPFYLVRYEDDDEEDLDEDELRQCILGPATKRPKRRESASRAAQSEEDNSDNDAEQAKASGRPQRTRARSSSAIQEGDNAVKTKRHGRPSRNTILAEDSEDTADVPKKRSMTRRSRARRAGS